MAWAKGQTWLADRTVIWVDSPTPAPEGHTDIRRPVPWPALPITLARALEENAIAHSGRPDFGHSSFSVLPPTEQASDQTPSERVLVVDDSLAVRNHLQSLLGDHGLNVTAVDSGEAAVSAISANSYKCILMDVLMPGMDGYETCRRIKSLPGKKALPIVMLTSKSSPFDRIRGKMAGCDAYLTKPVNPNDLRETLRHFVRFGSNSQFFSKL
ncbi:MAG: response regulator [Pseudomonadota bacterium]|nr:response regulator [Pseudomonadota bacterium]